MVSDSSNTLTPLRSCCSACRLRWSRQFSLYCPVGRSGKKKGHSSADLRSFSGMTVWSTTRDTNRKKRWDQKQEPEGKCFKLKNAPCGALLPASWHIPETFQDQIPQATPPDSSRKAPWTQWAQIKACFAACLSQRRTSPQWQQPSPGVICSWNVLDSRRTQKGSLVLTFHLFRPRKIIILGAQSYSTSARGNKWIYFLK